MIDINRIPDLEYIREEDGHLAIGALTRETALEESVLVEEKYPLLADTARVIADPLVRNLATVGGNLAHSDPANDHPATMLAYGASIVARGPAGSRSIPIHDFFVGLFANALGSDEILAEIRIPAPPPGSGGAYVKLERKVGDYAVSAVAVQLKLDGDTVRAARIGLTNVNPVPMRATDRYVADDAVEKIHVEYEPLEAVVDPHQALEDKVIVRDDKEKKTNHIWHWEAGDREEADRVFAEAAHTVAERMHIPRIHVCSIETCGMVANYNKVTEHMQIYMTSQAPHAHRTVFALVSGLPEHKIQIISPDIGGGFGGKVPVYPGYVCCAVASLVTGKPVKWIIRSE